MAILIVQVLLPLLADTRTLSLDRTNWAARRSEVNLLTLGAGLGAGAAALFWTDPRHQGNSWASWRWALVRRFIEVFGEERIGCLLGDGELVGDGWFGGLQPKRL